MLMQEQLYNELEQMGVNIVALRRANLTGDELAELTKSIRALLNNYKRKLALNHPVDVA